MNGDKVKGVLQKIGGHVEEAAGALVGDENLKAAGQEDQIKGEAREAWGNLKDAGDAVIDRVRVAKADAEAKAARAEAFDREHHVEVLVPKSDEKKAQEANARAEAEQKHGEADKKQEDGGEHKSA